MFCSLFAYKYTTDVPTKSKKRTIHSRILQCLSLSFSLTLRTQSCRTVATECGGNSWMSKREGTFSACFFPTDLPKIQSSQPCKRNYNDGDSKWKAPQPSAPSTIRSLRTNAIPGIFHCFFRFSFFFFLLFFGTFWSTKMRKTSFARCMNHLVCATVTINKMSERQRQQNG